MLDPQTFARAREANFRAAVAARRSALSALLAKLLEGRPLVTLEIGSGHGHWLAAYAAAHRDRFCLGVDLLHGRVEKAERKLARAGFDHAHMIKAEAVEMLELWPENSRLRDVFILYPDPWPKQRHHKNRLIQPEFLELLASRCAPGARLHFRTDHEDYGAWTAARLGSHPRWRLIPETPWPFEQETVFERVMGGPRVSLIAEVVGGKAV